MKDYLFLALVILVVAGLAWYSDKGRTPVTVTPAAYGNNDATIKPNSALKFDVTGSYEYYPDLSFIVIFKTTPTDTFLKLLNTFNAAYAKKYMAYTDTAIRDTAGGGYLLYYDFQGTPYSRPMLDEFFTGINNLPGSGNIKAIQVGD